MALAQPVSVVDDRCRAGFDAAVIAVDRLVPADRRGLEAVGLLLFDKHLNILAQGALVVLERENIVSPFVEDLARDGALAPHRVTGHDGAVDRQHVQQFRDRHDLVRLLRHLDLAKHQPSRRRKPYGWRLSCPFPDTSGAPSCRRSRSPRPARRSVTPPRRRNSAETSPHRAWRRYRRVDHATACHRQTAGTGAEARASASRSGRFPRSSRPPPGPPAGTAAAPHQAGRSPCHAAAGPAETGNDPEKQSFRPEPPPRPSCHPVAKSVAADGFRTLPRCHALFHPIALATTCLRTTR